MLFKTVFALALAAASVSAVAIDRSKIKCKNYLSVFLTVDINGSLTPLSLVNTDIVFSGGANPLAVEFQTCGGTGSDDPYTTFGRLYVPSTKQCIVALLTDDPTLETVQCEADETQVWKLSGGEGNEMSFVGQNSFGCNEWGYASDTTGNPQLEDGSGAVILRCLDDARNTGNYDSVLPFFIDEITN